MSTAMHAGLGSRSMRTRKALGAQLKSFRIWRYLLLTNGPKAPN